MIETTLQTIHVGCAIIEHEGNILIAQRVPGAFLGGYWEFPGGKLEENEKMEQCLSREIREELGIEIRPRFFLRHDTYRYPERLVHLYFFVCHWVAGSPVRRHCLDFRWVAPKDLRKYQFPYGDDAMISDLIRKEGFYFGRNVRNHYLMA